ncbi:MAG: hypothetical protein KIT02_08525 [Devosia sp.]|uniref:GumC family protein n=1 Tax=Devosia sp. TaxID=1871048 RepID=UPI0024C7E266|nr:Wzz/FepE/Etk N-terminal domain-containing protein [Devosia sp.]UYO01229.1 MAG: hypothetical protein KIT02_08525 [Devosia sp.]
MALNSGEIDLRSIAGLLARRYRLIAATVAAFIIVAIVASLSITPIFSASALVLVDPSRKDLLASEGNGGSSSTDSFRIDSEVEIVASDSVLLRVIDRENLASQADLGVNLSIMGRIMALLNIGEPSLPSAEDATQDLLANLRKSVDVQRRGLTYLIEIEAHSPDPAQAARLANAVTDTYIEQQLASKVNSVLTSRDLLEARIVEAQQKVTETEAAFDSFLNGNLDELSVDARSSSTIAGLRSQIDQIETTRRDTAGLKAGIDASLASNDWNALVTAVGTAAIAELEGQREALLARIGQAPVAPQNLQDELLALENQLRSAASQRGSELQAAIVESQSQESQLRQSLRSAVVSGATSPELLTRVYSLQQGAELARQQYDTLLARIQEVEAQAALQVPDSRVVSPALSPRDPTFPNKTLIVLLATFTGAAVAIGLAFLYENFIGGFTSQSQAEQVLRTRVSNIVPTQKTKSDLLSPADLVSEAPLSTFPEAIRKLRNNLMQVLAHKDGDPGKVVMISSTLPREGKSTLALSLARSFALAGRRVTLIDCDLRKPGLHTLVGVSPSHGLLEYLSGENPDSLPDIVSGDPLTDATLILGTRRSDIPTDQLLLGTQFERLIAAAREHFDVVIIDTSPLAPVVDGLAVAPHADAALFVTRWASTGQSDARQALSALRDAMRPEAEILVALNQQDQSRTARLHKFGNYYSEAY